MAFYGRHRILIFTILGCACVCFVEAGVSYLPASQGVCKTGGSWHRPGNKPATLAGFKACRDQCAQQGYQHFGGECPMGSYFHCQCSNTNLGSAVALSTSTCLRNVGHCGGPFTITDTENGVDYYLGAHSYGSVYSVTEVAPPTSNPTAAPTATPISTVPEVPIMKGATIVHPTTVSLPMFLFRDESLSDLSVIDCQSHPSYTSKTLVLGMCRLLTNHGSSRSRHAE